VKKVPKNGKKKKMKSYKKITITLVALLLVILPTAAMITAQNQTQNQQQQLLNFALSKSAIPNPPNSQNNPTSKDTNTSSDQQFEYYRDTVLSMMNMTLDEYNNLSANNLEIINTYINALWGYENGTLTKDEAEAMIQPHSPITFFGPPLWISTYPMTFGFTAYDSLFQIDFRALAPVGERITQVNAYLDNQAYVPIFSPSSPTVKELQLSELNDPYHQGYIDSSGKTWIAQSWTSGPPFDGGYGIYYNGAIGSGLVDFQGSVEPGYIASQVTFLVLYHWDSYDILSGKWVGQPPICYAWNQSVGLDLVTLTPIGISDALTEQPSISQIQAPSTVNDNENLTITGTALEGSLLGPDPGIGNIYVTIDGTYTGNYIWSVSSQGANILAGQYQSQFSITILNPGYLGPGTHTATITITDGDNDYPGDALTSSPVNVQFTVVDVTPPTTTISLSGTQGLNGWYTSDVTVTLTATDTCSGVATTQYSFDDVNWYTYNGPFTISTEGLTNIFYYSIDNAGNVENLNYKAVFIDKTPPVTSISLSGTPGLNGWYTSDVAVTLTATDYVSGVYFSGVHQTEYSFDGITWNIYTGPFTISTEGATTVYYRSIDNAGNVENTNTAVIMIDKTPPVTSISLSGTPGLNGWYTSNVTATLTATDSVSGVSTTEYSFDGVNWNIYTGPFTISTEGVTTVYYNSTDNAGNVENTNTITVMIDKTPPVTSISLSGTLGLNGWYTSDVTATLTATDSVSGVAITEYSFDNTTWNIYTGPFTISTEGVTTVYYNSTDNAGNVENTNTAVIMIDKTPPVTSISLSGTLGLNGWYTSNVNVSLTASDNVSGVNVTEYSFDGITWNIYTGPFTISTEGVTTVYYRSIDNAGNVENTNTAVIMIDKTPPVTSISLSGTPGLNGWYTSNVNVTLTAIDNVSGVALTEYSLNGTTSWNTYTGPFTISAEGVTTLYYNSTDNAGNVEAMNTKVIMVDKTPPVTNLTIGTPIYIDSAGNVYVTSATNFTLTATDSISGVAHTYYRINGGNWTEYTGAFNIKGPIKTYTIDYYSVDVAGNSEPVNSKTVILEEEFHGWGVLRIGGELFSGDTNLFLSEHMIRVEVGGQIATWNITKQIVIHCGEGSLELYWGKGSLGDIFLTIQIQRGETSPNVLAVGRGVFFCSCMQPLIACQNKL
jgi:hypothetical protein